MDFLHPGKKRKHQIRLFLGYLLTALALGTATYIIVIMTMGYYYDRSTGGIIQKGLVVLDTHPESADIYIDGSIRGRTNNRLTLPEGTHTIELRSTGYRTWHHDINLEGSSIEQLVYPFMFPESLVPKSIKDYGKGPSLVSQSPDRRWLITSHAGGELGVFDLLDLNNTQNPSTILTLPADTLSAGKGSHSFTAIEWAADNTHLLMKHSWKGGLEFIVLNRARPLQSLNLSKLFPTQTPSDVQLRDKKADQFYFYNKTTQTLAAVDSNRRSLTSLLKHVIAYKGYKNDTIVYASDQSNSKTTTEVHLWKNGRDFLLRTLPASNKYLLDAAEFNGRLYLATGSIKDGRNYVYKDPMADLGRTPARTPQPFRVLIVKDAEFVSFSTIARFIAVQGGSNFVVYDAETGRQFRYDSGLKLPAHSQVKWMDGHRFVTVSATKTVVFDFDNTNYQVLNTADSAYPILFSRDYQALFSFGQDNKTIQLQRTELIAKP